MKIKLVTFAPHPNFGTCLQSYALNYVLRKMGHNVEFIYNGRENPPLSFKQYIIKGIKKIIKHFIPEEKRLRIKESIKPKSSRPSLHVLSLPHHPILNLANRIFQKDIWYENKKHTNLQWRKVYKFTFEDNNFCMKRIYTHKQYNEVTDDADLFITGSDQIWNPYCGGYNPMMFLEFAGNTKRVAYSSSISQPEIPIEIKERMKNALSKFTHIAVREQRSVELLNQLLNRNDVKLVVDPTYLLSATEWEEFGEKAVLEFPLPEKYIFCYFVGDKRKDVYEEMVQQVKLYTGINEVITLECYNREYAYGNGRLYKDAGPYEWVYLLRHASYICMDSFHATVFALKFQKEFVHVMKNEKNEIGSQNTRMHDILNRYSIAYKNYNDVTDTRWQQIIDYKKVNPIINAEIEDSMKFLKYEIENN
jgi:hypothetical protein